MRKSRLSREKQHLKNGGGEWCRNQDSNSGPDDYKSTALPTELLRRIQKIPSIIYINGYFLSSGKLINFNIYLFVLH